MPFRPWIVDLSEAQEISLCGGKAVNLGKLIRAGIPIPDGICLTTEVYRTCLEQCQVSQLLEKVQVGISSGLLSDVTHLLAAIRLLIEEMPLLPELEAVIREALAGLTRSRQGPLVVRSSASIEDTDLASHAGLHTSYLGLWDPESVLTRVKSCWAGLWTDQAWAYRDRAGLAHAEAGMAVIVQRLVEAESAGVAFSADPLTGNRQTVVINAGWGIGEPLVAGQLNPDEFIVWFPEEPPDCAPILLSHRTTYKDSMTVWQSGHLVTVPVPAIKRGVAALSEQDAIALATLVKQIEQINGAPQDVEWAFERRSFWILQARPISTKPGRPGDETLWTRANLKEIFPEQPSVLALSYLQVFLNRMFRAYYGKLGYPLPPQARLVTVFRGRPYLNLTLLQQMAAAKGGDPALVPRLLGGAGPPADPPVPRRPTGTLRELLRLGWEIAFTLLWTPARAKRLFRLIRGTADRLGRVSLRSLTDQALRAHLEEFRGGMEREETLCRIQEVISAETQAYVVLEQLLAAWLPEQSPALLSRLVTGVGTLPTARLTQRLMALASLAWSEQRVRIFFLQNSHELAHRYRAELAGTRFLAEFEPLLIEFGHRAPYESDAMSPRFREDPTPLFRIIQAYMRGQTLEDLRKQIETQRHVRRQAVQEVRQALLRDRSGWVPLRWWIFRSVYGGLCRLIALRDEVRHTTTLLVAELRRVALEIGRRAVKRRLLTDPDEVFLLTWDELPTLVDSGPPARDLNRLVLARRRARQRETTLEAPDLLQGERPVPGSPVLAHAPERGVLVTLTGLGVSPGFVTGRARVLQAGEAIPHLDGTEILVLPVIDPVWTPLFPLIRGLIAEMGGLLSHGSILAREYGLPTVVNVRGVTRLLRTGDTVQLDGCTGQVQVVKRSGLSGNQDALATLRGGAEPAACSRPCTS